MLGYLFEHPRLGFLRTSRQQIIMLWLDAADLLDRLMDESPDWTMRRPTREEQVRMSLYDGALQPWKASHLSLNLEAALARRR
jgi:hypothetical protein